MEGLRLAGPSSLDASASFCEGFGCNSLHRGNRVMSATRVRVAAAILIAPLIAVSAPVSAQRAQTLPSVPAVPSRPVPPAQTLPGGPVQPTPLPQPVPPPGWNASSYFAGTTRCESQNHRPRTCRAATQNRVEIVEVHGGSCARGRSFTYDRNSIRVTDGCRATFAYGYGNVRPQASGGSSALPWVLAGAGATAGIIAIANSGNDSPPPPEARPAPAPAPVAPPVQPAPPPVTPAPPAVPQPPFAALPPAKLEANIQMLTPDQQRTMQTCLFEAARQTGVTGGTHVRLDSVDEIVQGNGGWRFRFRATGTWPNGQRQYSAFCRATPAQVIEFTVARV